MSAVCHGPAIFANIKDRATGKPIISGKTITGFTNEGEDVLKIMTEIKSWGKPLVEEHAAALGATCEYILFQRNKSLKLIWGCKNGR